MTDSGFFYGIFYKRNKLEDFVTDILAQCIRLDPKPFLAVLQSARVITPSSTTPKIVTYTQVGVSGAGVIDLMLYFGKGFENRNWDQIWIEVKVDSPESGNQIDNYLAYIAAQSKEAQPRL